jgi:hypothetical protein
MQISFISHATRVKIKEYQRLSSLSLNVRISLRDNDMPTFREQTPLRLPSSIAKTTKSCTATTLYCYLRGDNRRIVLHNLSHGWPGTVSLVAHDMDNAGYLIR